MIEEWKMEHKMFLERKTLRKSNEKKLYALVWGQCTQALKSEMMSLVDYGDSENRENSLWLLINIKIISTGVDATANVMVTYHQQFMSVSFIRQSLTELMEEYLKEFNVLATTTKLAGAENIWYCKKLFNKK